MLEKIYKPLPLLWECMPKKKIFMLMFAVSAFGYSAQASIYILIGQLLDIVNAETMQIDHFWLILFAILGANVLAHVCYRLTDMCHWKSVPHFQEEIRRKLVKETLQRSTNMFTQELAGSISARIANIPLLYKSAIRSVQWTGVGETVTIFITLFFAFKAHVYVGFFVLVWMILSVVISFLYVKKKVLPSVINLSKKESLFSGYITDIIANFATVITSNWQKNNQQKFNQSILDAKNAYVTNRISVHIFYLLLGALELLFLSLAIYISAKLMLMEQMSLGEFATISVLLVRASGSIWELCIEAASIMDQYAALTEGLNFLSQYPMCDHHSGKKLALRKAPEMAFKNVSFRYKTDQEFLFENFNLTIHKSERIALVGYSGSGKTSLVNLLLEFYTPEAGKVCINNKNIHDYSTNSYREHISMISQDTSLFHTSVRENIAYGSPHATEADIITAAKKAHAHEFITKLEHGYESTVGDRGVQLSGGQRQRIAIARAILKNSPIFILDEATSALDSESEKYIQESLHEVMKDKTVIVIAHRLSTIAEMDRIIVLDNGKILEEGSHKDLLEQDGHYAKLWSMQSGGFLPD